MSQCITICVRRLCRKISWLIFITLLPGFVFMTAADAMPVTKAVMEIQPLGSVILVTEKFCSGDECICLDCADTIVEEHVYVSPPTYHQDIPYDEEHVAPPPCEKATLVEKRHVESSSERSFDTSCGIRCWYWRLRKGYCGRGCDYYQFRAYDYPYGQLKGTTYADCKH